MRVEHRLDVGHVRGVEGEVDLEQRRSLQLDAAFPALARLGEHRPADAGLRPDAVDMGADGRGPVRIGRAQAEIHAQRDVGCGPVGGAIRRHGVERAHEVAVGFGARAPDMRLVEMGVRVDEGRQDDPAAEVHARGFAGLHGARRQDLGEATAFDQEIDAGEAVAVDALGLRRADAP